MRSLTSSAVLLSLLLGGPPALAGDLTKIDRSILKEPAYRTRAPKYGLLVFGHGGKDRVWLVLDGDILYVDRNGNGDLTEPGKKVAAESRPGRDPLEDDYLFNVGEVTLGGRTHKGLTVSFGPLKAFGQTGLGDRPDVKAALTKDAKALSVSIRVDVEMPGLKGGGLGGRVAFSAGAVDLDGVLQFAAKPAEAPIVHPGGPLQITFFAERPTLRVGRGSELVLVVGSPGVGPGTFAMLEYEGTVPATVKPVADVSLLPAKGGGLLKEQWVIQGRC
jgi:hypothetical protein